MFAAACGSDLDEHLDGGSGSDAGGGTSDARAPGTQDGGFDGGPGGRQYADQPDETDEYQIHLIYMVPADGEDRGLDLDGSMERSTRAYAKWLVEQTGGPTLRFDTRNGALDISFYRSTRPDAEIAASGLYVRNELEAELATVGFNAANKIYAVYYDGTSHTACGGGAYPPALIGTVAALYLRGLPDGPIPCIANPLTTSVDVVGYPEFAMLHEIIHTLGLVPACAPNHTLTGHASDGPTDLMYSGTQPWYPAVLDIGNDDYWEHDQAGCPDLADSVFLDPLPANAEPPPGW